MADVSTLHSKLKAKKLDNFYIFAGEEWKVQDIYMEQISKISKKSIARIDSIFDIVKKRKGNAFIKQSNVYVVRDDKDIMTDEKIWAKLDSIIKDDILILLVSSVDKRTKFYKQYESMIYMFETLETKMLKQYLLREKKLSDKNLDKLIEVCEGNYGRCLLEIDKIKRFIPGCKTDNRDLHTNKPEDFVDYCFKLLLADGTIHTPPKDAIFEFVDAILDADTDKIFNLYEQCKAVGEATMVMLSVLYNNARAVLQVQTCTNKDVGKSTGLTGWQIMNAKKHLRVWSDEDLEHIMQIVQKCESGIKTGKIADEIAMDYVLVNIL